MLDVIWLIPALPLAGFVILFLLGRRLGDPLAGWLATLTCAGSFVVTVGVFLELLSHPTEERVATQTLFTWLPVGGLKVDLALLADPLSITMALFVTGIGALIHLYAIGYMHGDPKFSKFFLYLNLFAFSMLMLVLGENMLVSFLGWEGVGVCSYFLISFWHTRNSAAVAGKKAFVTNRIGDWGFMVAMFLTFQAVGSLSFGVLNEKAAELSSTTALAIALLLFVGACGKSAQLPLYVWLPDAMEGPTPVSALIHAATMVTAGVYLMCRVSPLLHAAPEAGTVIAIVGVATALFAATIAVAQNDIKKVLAYSTISQLGYMFLAVGSGAYVAAVFHMVTHAFFKALLFLGSGSVIHGMDHEQDMRFMGALRKAMPVTAATFIVGWLAIAGVPPFAGFWSKDEILLFAWHKSPVLWAAGLVTALLTAYYMTRQVMMVFYGEARWTDARPAPAHDDGGHIPAPDGSEPHESPWIMLAPLVVLAFLSVVGGALNLPFTENLQFLDRWLEPVVEEAQRHLPDGIAGLQWTLAIVAVVVAVSGIVLGWLVYQRKRIKAVEPTVLANGWYVDATYARAVAGPGTAVFEAVATADATIVDGAVNGVARDIGWLGTRLRRVQTGFVRNYALGIAVGAVGLLTWFVVRGVL
ncbi:MAG TPA: NADH-quinone oxidoreductase subunit L [Acidimicrobiales bacterium]